MVNLPNEEYARRYIRIYALLKSAYMDKYLLEEIDRYTKELNNEKGIIDTRVYSVLTHLCELIKKDLCLIIWKVYCDTNTKANTLMSLGRFLTSITHKRYPTELSKELRRHKDTISNLRSKWLAHNDTTSTNDSIEIQVLYTILDELREILNSLCDKKVCSSIAILSDFELIPLKLNGVIGFTEMLYRDNRPVGLEVNTDGHESDELEPEIR